jgi:hypothetical protein
MADVPRRPDELAEADRERIRLAHHRLRKASQELEALLATKSMRGRWEPVSAPPEVLETARRELARAYEAVRKLEEELLGWDAPAEWGP